MIIPGLLGSLFSSSRIAAERLYQQAASLPEHDPAGVTGILNDLCAKAGICHVPGLRVSSQIPVGLAVPETGGILLGEAFLSKFIKQSSSQDPVMQNIGKTDMNNVLARELGNIVHGSKSLSPADARRADRFAGFLNGDLAKVGDTLQSLQLWRASREAMEVVNTGEHPRVIPAPNQYDNVTERSHSLLSEPLLEREVKGFKAAIEKHNSRIIGPTRMTAQR